MKKFELKTSLKIDIRFFISRILQNDLSKLNRLIENHDQFWDSRIVDADSIILEATINKIEEEIDEY